jgi:cytochrome c553
MKLSLIHLALACLVTAPVFAADPEVAPAPATVAPTVKPVYTANPDQEIARLIKHKADLVKGQEAYKVCRGCHKADASGKPEAGYPQLAGQHVSVLIKQMVDVRAGRRSSPKMHPFIEADVVATEEVADIATYLNSLPIPENAKGEGTMLEHGEKLYTRQCATCHGKGGEGDAKKFIPRVAGQHYLYLYKQTLESRDHGRNNSNAKMVKVLQPYSEADIAAVSDYMARLPVKR